MHTYCHNNPVLYIDPSGHSFWGAVKGAVIGAVGGAIVGTVAGAIAGGPAGAVVGAIGGAVAGAIIGASIGASIKPIGGGQTSSNSTPSTTPPSSSTQPPTSSTTTQPPAVTTAPAITSPPEKILTTEQERQAYVTDFLKSSFPEARNIHIAAILGNMQHESPGFNPVQLENDLSDPSRSKSYEYLTTYDNADCNNPNDPIFNDNKGWGIIQWTYSVRKQELLRYAKENNGSVGDLDIQLGFLLWESNHYSSGDYAGFWNQTELTNATDYFRSNIEITVNGESERRTNALNIYGDLLP